MGPTQELRFVLWGVWSMSVTGALLCDERLPAPFRELVVIAEPQESCGVLPYQVLRTSPLSQGHLAMSEDVFGCHKWGRGGLLLASSEQRTEMLFTSYSAQDGAGSEGLSSLTCQ